MILSVFGITLNASVVSVSALWYQRYSFSLSKISRDSTNKSPIIGESILDLLLASQSLRNRKMEKFS